jgi:hypothetical protein
MATTVARAANVSEALVWDSRLISGNAPRYMAGKTGGGVSTETTTEYDGGSKVAEQSSAPSTIENVVCTLRYKPAIDHAMIKGLRKQVGNYVTTLNMLDTDADFKPIPGVEPDVFPNALLVGVGGIDYDRNGTGTRTCQLTYAVSVEA